MEPITLRFKVLHGCFLSIHLFTAAISSLLYASQRLPYTDVKMTSVDRPRDSANANIIDVCSSTMDNIELQRIAVGDYLSWASMVDYSAKCVTKSIQRDVRV